MQVIGYFLMRELEYLDNPKINHHYYLQPRKNDDLFYIIYNYIKI